MRGNEGWADECNFFVVMIAVKDIELSFPY